MLFTGDTLAWDTDADGPHAFDDACQYDWGVLPDSLLRLLVHDFAWILSNLCQEARNGNFTRSA